MKPIKPLLHAALLSLFLFCGLALHAQSQFPCGQNLVPNPGFEDHAKCPDTFSELSLATPWFQPSAGTSDYFNPCGASSVGVPNNFAGSQPAHGGQAYAGEYMYVPNYREYMEVPLLSPLVAGETYTVSFYVSLSSHYDNAVTNIGAYLSANSVTLAGTANLPFIPQVQNPAGNFLTSASWTLIQGTFTAAGGESYLTIGNFYDDAHTPIQPGSSATSLGYSYYYIDDVSVVAPGNCMNSCSNSCITISSPNDFAVVTCSNSLPVFFSVGATDNCCASFTLTTVPASGSTFPLGTTLVTSTVTDNCGNTNSCSFNLTVIQDTNPPVIISSPSNLDLCMNCNGCGLMPDATSELKATNADGSPATISQNIPPGTEICSDTTVTFTVADACGDATNCIVPLTLINCTSTNNCLQIQCWTNIVVYSCTNLPVSYNPTATDRCCSNWIVTCSPPSGSYFESDTTNTVTCVATDLCGNASSCCFTVTVLCTNCLQIQCWTNIVLSSCTNLPVFYNPTATDLCCSNLFTFCTPPSGSTFNVGTTQTVTFGAADACGNSNSCTFTVTVNPSYPRVQTPGNLVIYSCTNVPVVYPPLVVNDPCCGTNWSVVYDPPSGTSFAPDSHTLVNWYAYDCNSGTNFFAANSFLVSVVCTNCCEGPITNYTVTVVKGTNYLADCLCQGVSNMLAEVIPSAPDGTAIYFWNTAVGHFNPPDIFTGGAWQKGTESMSPGEGFLLVSLTNQYQLTIYGINPGCGGGCSPLDCFSPTVLIGDYGLDPNPVDICELVCCPPVTGTGVQAWNATSQSFATFAFNGGWSPPPGPSPLPVGYSEFVSVNTSNCLTGSSVIHITQFITNQTTSVSMSWFTNAVPININYWQPQYSTDLVHWLTFPITGGITPPIIINETGSFYRGAPYQFYRLASTNILQPIK